jgi:arylsulfatase
VNPPWDTGAILKEDPAAYPWELYDLTKDWTQSDNIVDKNPAKLKELEELFWKEAEKYRVLPLDNSVVARLISPKPSLSAGRTVFTYSREITGTPNGDVPIILNSSYNFKAEIEVPDGGGNGMLVTQGGRFGGYGFYLLKGKPVFLWNLVDLKRVRWEGPEALTPGKHTVEFSFKYEGLGMGTLAFDSPSGVGRGGTGVLKVDGKVVASQSMEHTLPFILQWDENFDVGPDTGTPVDDQDYQVPFEFNGKLIRLTLTIDRPQLTPADIEKLKEAARNSHARE